MVLEEGSIIVLILVGLASTFNPLVLSRRTKWGKRTSNTFNGKSVHGFDQIIIRNYSLTFYFKNFGAMALVIFWNVWVFQDIRFFIMHLIFYKTLFCAYLVLPLNVVGGNFKKWKLQVHAVTVCTPHLRKFYVLEWNRIAQQSTLAKKALVIMWREMKSVPSANVEL